MDSHARLHAELIAFIRQHCPARDQRHLVLLGWMVAGLLLSQTVCFDHWKTRLPLGNCLASSWQRRCQRWLNNSRIDPECLYSPLILWAIQGWQNPGHTLHLALDTTMLWNRICVVVLSVVCHGRAIPLLWQTLEHPSASVSAAVSIGLLEKADRLLAGFGAIMLLADRAFPCAELLSWFHGRDRWSYVMRLPGDTEIHGTAAPLGCQVRRLRLRRGQCRGFRGIRLWADGSHSANLVLAHPTGLAVEEPWYLISNASRGRTRSRMLRLLPCDDWAQAWQLEKAFRPELMPPMRPGHGAEDLGTYMRRRTLWQQLRREYEEQGEKLVLYSCRHGYAHRAHVICELPPKVVAAAMGHSVETHLAAYSRWCGDDVVGDAFAKAARRLEPGAPAEVA